MKSLETTSPAKKNLRLANWAIFLSQFWHNLDVRYYKGIENILADGLSRLRTEAIELSREEYRLQEIKEADEDTSSASAFTAQETTLSTSLVRIQPEFKNKISEAYADDIHFGPILKVLRAHLTEYPDSVDKATDMVSRPKSPYAMLLPEDNPLLFWKDEKQQFRLCIPRAMAKQILELAHDKENHYGLAKTYARLTASYYFPKLLKLLESYIAHCPKCAINRTLRHRPYGDAQPIETESEPLYTLTMDFILGLPPSRRFSHGDELFDTIRIGS
jgi:hypothetical protein